MNDAKIRICGHRAKMIWGNQKVKDKDIGLKEAHCGILYHIVSCRINVHEFILSLSYSAACKQLSEIKRIAHIFFFNHKYLLYLLVFFKTRIYQNFMRLLCHAIFCVFRSLASKQLPLNLVQEQV